MPDGVSVFYFLVCLSASSRSLRSLSREVGVGMYMLLVWLHLLLVVILV